jgi:hypothetical protein
LKKEKKSEVHKSNTGIVSLAGEKH